jgi:hypothetical protein
MPGLARIPGMIADDVIIFASASERTSLLPSPTAGTITYLQDIKAVQYWDGTIWKAVGGGVAFQSSAPSTPSTGDMWVDSDGASAVLNENDFLLKADAAVIYDRSDDYTQSFFMGI